MAAVRGNDIDLEVNIGIRGKNDNFVVYAGVRFKYSGRIRNIPFERLMVRLPQQILLKGLNIDNSTFRLDGGDWTVRRLTSNQRAEGYRNNSLH